MRISAGRKKIRLGDLLVAAGAITDEELQEAIAYQKEKGMKLGQALVEMGFVSQELLNLTISQQLGIEYIDLKACKLTEDVLRMIPEKEVMRYRAVPVEIDEYNPNVLKVAMSDPMDIIAIDDLAILTNMQIEPMLTSDEEITEAIGKYYGNQQAMEVAEQYRREREQEGLTQAEEEAVNDEIDNSPIVLLVKQILEGGVRQRASDIHIEALETSVRVRYRIDGSLKKVMTYDYSLMSAIVARIKIIGGMDISEKRKPQDGRITQMVDRLEYDIRVSVLPTVYGEKIVMRLASKTALNREKSKLGFRPEEMKRFDHILKNPHGIILVTGPTGSGKSTTLYTALSELNTEYVNIITVEDPVEANIDGINQVHVNPKADLTFASALRSILRQDPDIIMIGEIRDQETASIAVQASITGHLVVSTLHTNSSASTITRLADMGIEPYLIADSTVGVIAQRLVRRLCPACKKARLANEEEKEIMGLKEDQDYEIYEPCGCFQCDNMGYKGRIGVYEIMEMSPALRHVISKNGDAEEIKDIAIKEGMNTLRMSATQLVLDGITSVNEMMKVSFDS